MHRGVLDVTIQQCLEMWAHAKTTHHGSGGGRQGLLLLSLPRELASKAVNLGALSLQLL